MRYIRISWFGRSTAFAELPSASSVESGENDKKAVDQTNVENSADLFRVHVLRGRSLTGQILGSNDCAGTQRCGRLSSFAFAAQTQSGLQ
jgi:hypothetical protein